MKDPKEFLLMMAFFLICIGLGDLFAVRYYLSHFKMNGDSFSQVGMMEYTNPTDGKTLYFLMYTKEIKKGDK